MHTGAAGTQGLATTRKARPDLCAVAKSIEFRRSMDMGGMVSQLMAYVEEQTEGVQITYSADLPEPPLMSDKCVILPEIVEIKRPIPIPLNPRPAFLEPKASRPGALSRAMAHDRKLL